MAVQSPMQNNINHDTVPAADTLKPTTPVVYTSGIKSPMIVNFPDGGGGPGGGGGAHSYAYIG